MTKELIAIAAVVTVLAGTFILRATGSSKIGTPAALVLAASLLAGCDFDPEKALDSAGRCRNQGRGDRIHVATASPGDRLDFRGRPGTEGGAAVAGRTCIPAGFDIHLPEMIRPPKTGQQDAMIES